MDDIVFEGVVSKITEVHQAEYGVAPEVISYAPGHFQLMGDHSWFFKDKTLSMATDIPLFFAVSKRNDLSCRSYFYQTNERKRAAVNAIKPKKDDKWSKFIKAIIEGFSEYGYEVGGVNITIYSSMKTVGCFGFPTALKVASSMALRALYNFDCDDLTLFQVSKYANAYLDKLTFESDNYTVMYSKKDTLFVLDYATGLYDTVDFPFTDKTAFIVDLSVPRLEPPDDEALFDVQNALLLGDLKEDKSGVYGGWQYISNATEINEQLSSTTQDVHRRLLCIMKEHKDILDAMKAMERGDFTHFATCINHSNESMRDLYDLSSPETNWILRRISEFDPVATSEHRVISCGRVLGRGSPRYVYVILRDEDIGSFEKKLEEYEHIFGFHPNYYKVGTADGAKVIYNAQVAD